MTTKTIKVVLLAALTVALFVPFSLMENAYAEKVTDSLTIPNAERDLKLANGYKLYPGLGWIDPTKVKEVEPVYRINPDTGDKVLDLDAMIEKSEKSKTIETSVIDWIQELMSLFTIPLAEAGNGWNQIAHKDSSNNDFSYLRAYWNVPDAPTDYDGGTNFSFPGIQPNVGSSIIFQPVVQHGYSSICDAGDAWVTYAVIMVGSSAYHTPCEDADDGDRIRGTISESNNYWTIAMKNYQNSAANDSYVVYSSTTMKFGAVAVETWNLGNDCDELQGDLEFDKIYHSGDTDNFSSSGAQSPFCGQSTNIVSESDVEMFNNN